MNQYNFGGSGAVVGYFRPRSLLDYEFATHTRFKLEFANSHCTKEESMDRKHTIRDAMLLLTMAFIIPVSIHAQT